MGANKIIIAVVILGILGAIVFYVSSEGARDEEAYGGESNSSVTEETSTVNQTQQEEGGSNSAVSAEVDITGGVITTSTIIRRTTTGFEPATVTIRQGDTVTFINDSTKPDWPASNVHPTHQIYSEFDPKRPLAAGESWSFTFTKVGEWKFHDHLQANVTGLIIVTP